MKYLEGLRDCEKMYQSGDYTVPQLTQYLEQEMAILDYHWAKWLSGFSDYISHIDRLESIGKV